MALSFYTDDPFDDSGWVVATWPQKMQADWVKQNNFVNINQQWAPGTCAAPEANEHYDLIGDPTDLHVKAFVDCVRARKRSKESGVEGHNAAVGAHLANLSYRNGSRKVLWDGKKATLA